MSLAALDKIKAIEEEAAKKIEALKQEAKTEIVKKLAEAKDVVAALEKEYEELTGKTVTGAKSTRIRLSPEQSAALVVKVESIIKSASNGISMGDVVEKAGASASAVRKAVKSLKGIKMTGTKATTLYHAK
jgi:hypothetical protein